MAMPRKPRVKRMHVADAGNGDTADAPMVAHFNCARCRHYAGWLKVESVTKARRGIPCPKCNADARPQQ